MIPFLEQPSLRLGPITIQAFGAIVAAAVYAGLEIGRRRFAQLGLDRALGERLAWWAVVGGFVGAHVFSLVFYFPEKLAARPWLLFKIWEDISSTGSVLGGMLGIWLFLRLKAADLDAATRWAYLDVAAFVFPISLMIGRIACSLAHDHPGGVTAFPLAVSLGSGRAQAYIAGVYADAGLALPATSALARLGFHDLGWYEFLYLALVVVPVVMLLDRRGRRRWPGFFLAAFGALYLPARFALDFLRVADARYAGLTPAQWTALAALAALPLFVRRRRRGWRGLAGATPDHAPPRTPAPNDPHMAEER